MLRDDYDEFLAWCKAQGIPFLGCADLRQGLHIPVIAGDTGPLKAVDQFHFRFIVLRYRHADTVDLS